MKDIRKEIRNLINEQEDSSLLDEFEIKWNEYIAPVASRALIRAVEHEFGAELDINIFREIDSILEREDCEIKEAIRNSLMRVSLRTAGKLKIGDRVRITAGEQKGRQGRVVGIYSDGVKVVIDGNKFFFTDHDKRLKKISV